MTQHFFNIGITKKSCDRQLQLQDKNKNLCYGVIDRVRESRNPKKVLRVSLMESYGEIGRVPVNLF